MVSFLDYSQRPFPEALQELLLERQRPHVFGKVNLRLFFSEVEGWSYEYLRKMVMGERPLQLGAIRAMAEAAGVPPEYFREYRLWEITEHLRKRPELIDPTYRAVVVAGTRREQPPMMDGLLPPG